MIKNIAICLITLFYSSETLRLRASSSSTLTSTSKQFQNENGSYHKYVEASNRGNYNEIIDAEDALARKRHGHLDHERAVILSRDEIRQQFPYGEAYGSLPGIGYVMHRREYSPEESIMRMDETLGIRNELAYLEEDMDIEEKMTQQMVQYLDEYAAQLGDILLKSLAIRKGSANIQAPPEMTTGSILGTEMMRSRLNRILGRQSFDKLILETTTKELAGEKFDKKVLGLASEIGNGRRFNSRLEDPMIELAQQSFEV